MVLLSNTITRWSHSINSSLLGRSRHCPRISRTTPTICVIGSAREIVSLAAIHRRDFSFDRIYFIFAEGVTLALLVLLTDLVSEQSSQAFFGAAIAFRAASRRFLFAKGMLRLEHQPTASSREAFPRLCRHFLQIGGRRQHTGEKPFEYRSCQKWFTLRDNLRQHINTYHGSCEEQLRSLTTQILIPNRPLRKGNSKATTVSDSDGLLNTEEAGHYTPPSPSQTRSVSANITMLPGLSPDLQAGALILKLGQPEIPWIAPKSTTYEGTSPAAGGCMVPDSPMSLHNPCVPLPPGKVPLLQI